MGRPARKSSLPRRGRRRGPPALLIVPRSRSRRKKKRPRRIRAARRPDLQAEREDPTSASSSEAEKLIRHGDAPASPSKPTLPTCALLRPGRGADRQGAAARADQARLEEVARATRRSERPRPPQDRQGVEVRAVTRLGEQAGTRCCHHVERLGEQTLSSASNSRLHKAGPGVEARICLIALPMLPTVAAARERSGGEEEGQPDGLLRRWDLAAALPRTDQAPVAVKVDRSFQADDGSDPPPQLREIAIGINRKGRMFNRGLPTCRIRNIQPSTTAAARRICGGAIVGSGHVSVRVSLAASRRSRSRDRCSSSTRSRGGKRRLLAQVYGAQAALGFVLTFKVVKQKGDVWHSNQDDPAGKGAEVGLRHPFRHDAAPHLHLPGQAAELCQRQLRGAGRLPGRCYPFARGKFGFAGGRQVTTTLIRNCSVR